jgi:hypothetical protein
MSTCTDPPSDQGPPFADPEFHPAAALFPLMDVDGPEFGELVEDIREHGLAHPIVRFEGKILDGRNRLRACQHAGVEPRFEEWNGESPTGYVLSLNLHRRHLTDGQRAAIAVEALPLFEAEARERQREAGRTTAGRERQPETLEANLPQPSHRAPQARDRAAAATGVAGRTVQTAKAIKAKAPDLAERVHAGTMSVHAAAKEVERREAEKVQATLDRVDPQGAVRQQQARLIADWSTQAAKVGHLVTDLMGFDLDEIVPMLDELNRYAAGVNIRLLRDYCDRLERLLDSTGGLQVIDGGRRQ